MESFLVVAVMGALSIVAAIVLLLIAFVSYVRRGMNTPAWAAMSLCALVFPLAGYLGLSNSFRTDLTGFMVSAPIILASSGILYLHRKRCAGSVRIPHSLWLLYLLLFGQFPFFWLMRHRHW
jgi:hypothetical protein